jgi:hypothetical protein
VHLLAYDKVHIYIYRYIVFVILVKVCELIKMGECVCVL